MATCQTAVCLKRYYSREPNPESVTRFVYYSKLVELNPSDTDAAKGFLDSLPHTRSQQSQLAILNTLLYWDESANKFQAISKFASGSEFHANLQHSIQAYPPGLRAFLAYGPFATEESYFNLATTICHAEPQRFLEAFDSLDRQDQEYFASHVVQPEGCKEIGLLPWDIPKPERPHLVAMAMCKSAGCITQSYARIAKPEIVARIVYYSNLLRLQRSSRRAAYGLLANIPTNDDQYSRLTRLAENLFQDETDAQIEAVAEADWHFSRDLAQSVKLYPQFLPAFIRYGRIAIQDAHDDYANWAARVCRSNPNQFVQAFQSLRPADKDYISHFVIEPKGCKQVAFPEAE